jgi:hypothetical protein
VSSISDLGRLFKGLEYIDVRQSSVQRENANTLFSIPYFPSETLRHVNIEEYLSPEDIERLCSLLPALEYLGCSVRTLLRANICMQQFPSLKTLKYGFLHPFRAIDHREFLNCFPNIEDLTIIQLPGPISRRLHGALRLPWIGLKSARFYGLYLVWRIKITSNILRTFKLVRLPNLTRLDIPSQPFLEELTIDSTDRLRPIILDHFRASSNTLRNLTITAPQFEERHIEQFICETINLRYIDISSLLDINDGIFKLLQSLKYLEELHVNSISENSNVIKIIETLGVHNGGRLRKLAIMNPSDLQTDILKFGVKVFCFSEKISNEIGIDS